MNSRSDAELLLDLLHVRYRIYTLSANSHIDRKPALESRPAVGGRPSMNRAGGLFELAS